VSIKAVAYALHESPYAGKKQLIHIAIADVVNNDTMVGFISQESIAKAAKCSIEFVRTTVREMIGNGHLEIVQEARQHFATVYRMVIPDASQPPTQLGADDAQPPTPAPKSDGAEESQPPNLTAQPPNLTAQPPNLLGDIHPLHPSLSSENTSDVENVGPGRKKNRRTNPDDEPDDEIRALCQLLADRLDELGVKHGYPSRRWHADMRKMRDIDGRTPDEIAGAIRWALADGCWWQPNIHSPQKLREKFDQMRLSANRDRPRNTTQEQNLDLIARLKAQEAG
jgi:hypothetical protein